MSFTLGRQRNGAPSGARMVGAMRFTRFQVSTPDRCQTVETVTALQAWTLVEPDAAAAFLRNPRGNAMYNAAGVSFCVGINSVADVRILD